MRTFAGLFVGGLATLFIMKLLAGLFLPLLGLVLGLIGMVVKITLFGLVAYFVYRFLTSRRRERAV